MVKLLFFLAFCMPLFLFAQEQPSKDSIAKQIKVVDSIALKIDSSQSFIQSKIDGSSDFFGLYRAIAFWDHSSDDLKKITSDLLLEQVTIYCSNGNILKIQEQKEHYYPINACYYNKNRNQETDEELLKKMSKYVEVFKNISALGVQK